MSAGENSYNGWPSVVAVVRNRVRTGQEHAIFAERADIIAARQQQVPGGSHLSDQDIVRCIERAYPGGWERFVEQAR